MTALADLLEPSLDPIDCPHRIVVARRYRAGWRGVCDACDTTGPTRAERRTALQAFRVVYPWEPEPEPRP
jgi:hypothetical protein